MTGAVANGTPDPDRRSERIHGFALIWGVNVVHVVVGFATIPLAIGAVLLGAFPVIQLLYAVPLIVIAWRNELRDRAKAMLIATCATTLLSSACSYSFWHS